jgi:hypothetical protein
MVAKHYFFFYSMVKLGCLAVMAENHPQRIDWFFAYFFLGKEIIAPGLLPQVKRQLKVFRVAYSANHPIISFPSFAA